MTDTALSVADGGIDEVPIDSTNLLTEQIMNEFSQNPCDRWINQ